MRWKDTRKQFDTWYKWFAWYPKSIDGQWVWLEYVERKATQWGWDYTWKYRMIDREGTSA
jgi:hypothetical protein